jgi:hypothetical protein
MEHLLFHGVFPNAEGKKRRNAALPELWKRRFLPEGIIDRGKVLSGLLS